MKNRIDKELVNKGLVPSRAKAQELIELGFVKCNNKTIKKCNYLIDENDTIEIIENDRLKYVSRGGLKLEKAINAFNIILKDLNIMDIGSSTGGFCDCAIQNGAKHITAIDVGTDLLHPSLRTSDKIDLHEQTNFKNLEHKYFENIDMFVCDVSFISLKKIVQKIYDENVKTEMVFLIKPQFECGKEIADKYKGIILNKDIHFNIIKDLFNYFNSLNIYVKDLTFSPIKGGDGNIEYLVYLSNKIESNNHINILNVINSAFKNH